ncbi:MAG: hypothetical protein K2Z81_17920, partial [Cyanobacteria bacterium]|nr:hypothetical protein [Cyanobacteriota bacterium]
TEKMDVQSWSDEEISFTAPHLLKGRQPVRIKTAGGKESDTKKMIIVESKLIPIRFVIEKPLKASDSDQVYISGDAVSLGEGGRTWLAATGPMLFSNEDKKYILCVPLPAGTTVNFKFITLNKNGRVVREESKTHSYTVPESGAWRKEFEWIP